MTKTHRSKVASDCVQMRSMQGNKTPRGAAPLSTSSAGICPRPLLNTFFFSFPKTISTFYIPPPLPRRILVFELSYWLGEAIIQPRLDHLLLHINHLPPRPCFLDEPPRRNQLGTFQLIGLMQLTLFLSFTHILDDAVCCLYARQYSTFPPSRPPRIAPTGILIPRTKGS
ncbi:hypothetical protein CCUS01_09574 [Colletotrichum cuscutae]|uniref:Uncharacterized protein n=1 Tax=Colletotrichum cuscutae TaxID=1209917 RepID=A0AAI9UGG5_9PEZI|nr:hypothetical protein CCUS01_09574 [Colletotrichum cuscutae]